MAFGGFAKRFSDLIRHNLMRTATALSNGLFYGAIAALVPIGMLFFGSHFSERSFAVTAIAMLLYANVGFFVAYCFHRQTSCDVFSAGPDNVPIRHSIRSVCFRIVAGLLLAAYVGVLVFFYELSNMIEVYGGVYEYLMANGSRPNHYLEIYTMSGAAVGAMFAAFVGAILAPSIYGGRMVIRATMMSSALGFLAGAFTSVVPGCMASTLASDVVAYSLALVVGSISGIAMAFALRLHARRRDLRW